MRLIDRIYRHYRSRAYRAAMMRAIRAAAIPSEIWGHCNRSDGLRAIRALERLSARPFDPFDEVSVNIVTGGGPKYHKARIRRA